MDSNQWQHDNTTMGRQDARTEVIDAGVELYQAARTLMRYQRDKNCWQNLQNAAARFDAARQHAAFGGLRHEEATCDDSPQRTVVTQEPRAEIRLPWWRMDRFGWPIETYAGKPFQSAMRIICQNLRKVTG